METNEATTRRAWKTITRPLRHTRSGVAAVLSAAALLFAVTGCERDYAEERDRLRPRPGTEQEQTPRSAADDDETETETSEPATEPDER
ncbi:MAG: hypothetical protein M3Y87_03275 [Myxococcota bacterium]|nr:hypothetical protein [Myxococcota bacterium]